MPRVSIIVPAYNVDRYVADALDSAISQTYADTEIIVVNDGSTDNTAEAIAPYRGRVKYIEQPNRGLAAARNTAISASSGEFIALLDSDDAWPPDRLEKVVSFLDDNSPMLAVTTDSYRIEESTYTRLRIYSSLPPRWRFKSDRQDYWITQFNFMQVHTVFRRSLIEQHGLFDEQLRACEDWDLWIRALTAGARFGLIDEPLAYYRIRRGSLSVDRSNLLPWEIRVLEKALGSGKAKEGTSGRIHFAKGKLHLLENDLPRARRDLMAAAADRHLFSPFRLKALLMASAPRLAVRSGRLT